MKEIFTNDSYKDLIRRVEITKDIRFQASARLERRHHASSFVISLLSLFVIALSLLPNLFVLTDNQIQLLLATTIIDSVFIIITSLVEGASNFTSKAEFLHRSAVEINSVFLKLKQLPVSDSKNWKAVLLDLQSEYQDALNNCPYNHETIDHMLVKSTKPSLFDSWVSEKKWLIFLEAFTLRIRHKVKEYIWLGLHVIVIIGSIMVLSSIVN